MPIGWSDETTTFADVSARIDRFLEERGWAPAHTPKNLAMSIAIESAELMEIFQWVDSREAAAFARENEERFLHVRQEIADVMIYCFSLCRALGIDAAAAIDEKIDHNAVRYPAPTANGDGGRGG